MTGRQSVGARAWTFVVAATATSLVGVLSVVADVVDDGALVLLAPMAWLAGRVARVARFVRRPSVPCGCPACVCPEVHR